MLAAPGLPAATQGIHAALGEMRVRSVTAWAGARQSCPSAPGPFA
jgi:hypothetical protein